MSEQITTATLVEPPPLGAGIYNYHKALRRELAQIPADTRLTQFDLGPAAQQRSCIAARQETARNGVRQSDLTRVELYDEGGEAGSERLYKLRVFIGVQAAKSYERLDDYQRHDLAWDVESGMVRAALRLYGRDDDRTSARQHAQHYHDESTAMMHYAPVLFEPTAQASIQGMWLDRGGMKTWHYNDRKHLILEGSDSTSTEQRQILLGGVASFLGYLDEQNS